MVDYKKKIKDLLKSLLLLLLLFLTETY